MSWRSLRRLAAALPAAAILIPAFFLTALPAAAEKRVSSWFEEKAGQPYAEVRAEIEQAAKIAQEAQVPEELLVERLAEGAAKGVPPGILQRAMEEEAGTLASLAALLDQRLPSLDVASRTEALRLGAIAARGGVDPGTVDNAVGWTIEGKRDLNRTMSALVAVAALRRALGMEAPVQLALTQALSLSREKTSQFGSFVSLLSAARARGLAAGTVVATTLDALTAGRTFLSLQRALERKVTR